MEFKEPRYFYSGFSDYVLGCQALSYMQSKIKEVSELDVSFEFTCFL